MTWIDRTLCWLVLPRGRREPQRNSAGTRGNRVIYEVRGALLTWLVRRDLQSRSHRWNPAPMMREQFRLGRPLASPHLTREQAIQVAQTACSLLFDHPFTIDYGSSWCDGEPVGTRDIWKITVSNPRIPDPGGRKGGGNAPVRYLATLVIIVDDKLGVYRGASGHSVPDAREGRTRCRIRQDTVQPP